MISIERLTKKDTDYISPINCLLKQLSTSIEVLDRRNFLKAVGRKDSCFFAAKDADKKRPENLAGIAMIFFVPRFEGTLAEIHTVVVDQDYRGKHIGDMLTETMVGTARLLAIKNMEKISIYLTSKPVREAANKLYQKHGFELVAKAEGEKGTNLYKLVITP